MQKSLIWRSKLPLRFPFPVFKLLLCYACVCVFGVCVICLHNACLDQKLNCAFFDMAYTWYTFWHFMRGIRSQLLPLACLFYCIEGKREGERLCLDWARLLCDRLNSKLLSVRAQRDEGDCWTMPQINHTISDFCLFYTPSPLSPSSLPACFGLIYGQEYLAIYCRLSDILPSICLAITVGCVSHFKFASNFQNLLEILQLLFVLLCNLIALLASCL